MNTRHSAYSNDDMTPPLAPVEGGEELSFSPHHPRSPFTHPADLPRDYGMARGAAVGAYEVKSLSSFVSKALDELTANFAGEDPLVQINRQLDALMKPEERHRVVAERFSRGLLELSLLRRSDRFTFSRWLIPKLRAQLTPVLGPFTVSFIDR